MGGTKRRLGAAALIVVAFAIGRSSPAVASMTGPCTAAVNGQDVTALSASDPGAAIEVGENDTIAVQAQSSSTIGSYRIQLEFAGIRWTVAKGDATNNRWTRAVNVNDYARYGAGLYRVHGVSKGAVSCDGAVLVKVKGNPLTTPVGLVGVGLVAIGIANAVWSVRSARIGAAS